MGMYKVSQHGTDVIHEGLAEAHKKTPKVIRQMWFQIARELTKVTKKDIKRKKAGNVYMIRSRGSGNWRKHTASEPGEAHANMHGDLMRSISWKVHGFTELEFGYGVSTTAKNATPIYARAIEFGKIKKPNTIEPRPSIGLNIANSNWERYFINGMDGAFK